MNTDINADFIEGFYNVNYLNNDNISDIETEQRYFLDEFIYLDKLENNTGYRILQSQPAISEKIFIYICIQGEEEYAKRIYKACIHENVEKFSNLNIDYFVSFILYKGHKGIFEWLNENNILSNNAINIAKCCCNTLKIIHHDDDYKFVKWLLDTILICNPNEMWMCVESNIDSMESCFKNACNKCSINFENIKLKIIDVLQIYRPFQFCFRNDVYMIKNNCLQLYFVCDRLFLTCYEISEFIKIAKNPNKINYEKIKRRMDYIPLGCEISLKEEIIRNRFHPKYIDKLIDWGHLEQADFEL
jgi:hypothetical protein